jgi:hypothetical protein
MKNKSLSLLNLDNLPNISSGVNSPTTKRQHQEKAKNSHG